MTMPIPDPPHTIFHSPHVFRSGCDEYDWTYNYIEVAASEPLDVGRSLGDNSDSPEGREGGAFRLSYF